MTDKRLTDAKEEYKAAEFPAGVHVECCPVCGSLAELWMHSTDFANGPIAKAVMCSMGNEIKPRDGIVNSGCLLYMPPDDFYRPTVKEAIAYWNEFAASILAVRKEKQT